MAMSIQLYPSVRPCNYSRATISTMTLTFRAHHPLGVKVETALNPTKASIHNYEEKCKIINL